MGGKYSRSKGISKSKKVWLVLIISAIVLLIVFFAIDSSIQRNYYMKELKVCDATVVEKSNDEGLYIKVRLSNTVYGVYISDDDLWVLEDGSCKVGQQVGLLVANYDIFKKKYWGLFGNKGQKFEKDKWVIEKLYSSYEQAQSDNPTRSVESTAVLKKKKTTQNGSMFFVLESEGRMFQAKVDQNVYGKYSVNQEIQCEFEGIGEFLKFSKIVIEN